MKIEQPFIWLNSSDGIEEFEVRLINSFLSEQNVEVRLPKDEEDCRVELSDSQPIRCKTADFTIVKFRIHIINKMKMIQKNIVFRHPSNIFQPLVCTVIVTPVPALPTLIDSTTDNMRHNYQPQISNQQQNHNYTDPKAK